MENRIIPHRDLRTILPRVEKPGRYVGGEFGSAVAPGGNPLRVAISYPDLYEIGMSNTSIRLIYRLLNATEGVACERVFAPAQDFEAELRARSLPLYSLESGRPLASFDLVGFSMGYELTYTNLLNILDLGGVPILRRERHPSDPIVIAGGPAITNPVPFGSVIDAVFVGEIEGEGIEVFAALAAAKARGAGRAELLGLLVGQPFVWTADKGEPVRRVLWKGFGAGGDREREGAGAAFPIPSIRTVQDHGVVEIMRGCPHGCRFCHAGIFYRPFRMKDLAAIVAEVDEQVLQNGYREVTLSSLSTGDYPGVAELVRFLNARYEDQLVSFNLPSLRISSVTLELLSQVSSVRKTGLTFAVETPLPEWQAGVNKPVSGERILDLLKEARGRGWRQAKFYFMIGLPVAWGQDECGPILQLLEELRAQVRMELIVNVSGFIPKPHTPFQWAPQLAEQEALERIMRVKRGAPKGVNVRYHSPFLSVLEGVVSRGDERAGELFVEAFRRGARFDSWEDLVDRKLWRGLFAEVGWDVEGESCRERAPGDELPWRDIRLGVTEGFLRREHERAQAGEQTPACCAGCTQPCGVCRDDIQVRDVAAPRGEETLAAAVPARPAPPPGERRRVLFSFDKQGRAAFL
ncbi:MAG: radical SAM protein, partial [Spirochaetales bacterium]|nr:radical SAM protein [Spirochaetales bacterium]